MYTGVDLQVIHFYLNSYKTPACTVICTEIVTQEFSKLPGDQIVSELLRNQTSPVLLFLSSGRDSQAVAYETLPSAACRTPKHVAKCGSCLSLGNPLRRSCMSEGEHVVWWNAKLLCPQQSSAEIVRFERPSMWWNVNFFWARAILCRDRAGRTSKHVAKCKFGGTRRSPFARNQSQPSKTGVKLWFWKFRCKRGMKVKRQ